MERQASSEVMSPESYGGDTSTTSMPHSGASLATMLMNRSISRDDSPPGSGVPVPGALPGSTTSMSRLRKIASVSREAISSAASAARSMPSRSTSPMVSTVVPRSRATAMPAPPFEIGSAPADDAAEPQVGGAGVDRLGHAGGGAVAAAVVGGAQMRAALHHPATDGGPVAGVDAAVAGRGAAAVVGVAVGQVPVAGPLPDVADHVGQAVAVGREPAHRGRAHIPVQLQVLVGELALPGVGHPAAPGVELIPPRVGGPVQAAPAGQLPFGLGRQVLAGPGGVGLDVGPGDVDHRVVGLAPDRAGRPLGVAPVGPGHIGPPVVVVAQVDGVAGVP